MLKHGLLLTLVVTLSSVMQAKTQFAERVAVYEYLRGNKEAAMLALSEDSGIAIGDINQVNRQLFRTEQLQQMLSSTLVGELPQIVSDQLWLDISELRRQHNNCEGALLALLNLKALNADMEYRQRFQQIACMLQQNLSKDVIIAAEKIAIKDQKKTDEFKSIWLAYIYNNLAVAAESINQSRLAQAYFKRALSHTDNTEEGQALRSYLLLNLAYSYYDENRFDYAQKTFAELDENSQWLDQGLLGFGWSAFKNNKPGLAMEAWRQLVNLPFQSINVYEGYLAIPFAFERQNAFSEALAGYESAIMRFTKMIEQIDYLQENLLIEDIQKHAKEYKKEGQTFVDPLHPLLVHAYAQQGFQDVLDTIGRSSNYLEKIQSLKHQLMFVIEVRQAKLKKLAQHNSAIDSSYVQIDESFETIKTKIDRVADLLLQKAAFELPEGHKLKAQVEQYASVQSRVGETLAYRDDLTNIRGALIADLMDDDLFNSLQMRSGKAIALTQQFTRANAAFESFQRNKAKLPSQANIDQKIYLLEEKLQKASMLVKNIQLEAEELLLGKTIAVLAEQKVQLKIYEDQARVSAARISEEFYQQGGQQLWR